MLSSGQVALNLHQTPYNEDQSRQHVKSSHDDASATWTSFFTTITIVSTSCLGPFGIFFVHKILRFDRYMYNVRRRWIKFQIYHVSSHHSCLSRPTSDSGFIIQDFSKRYQPDSTWTRRLHFPFITPLPKYQLFDFIHAQVEWIVLFHFDAPFYKILAIQVEWMPCASQKQQGDHQLWPSISLIQIFRDRFAVIRFPYCCRSHSGKIWL